MNSIIDLVELLSEHHRISAGLFLVICNNAAPGLYINNVMGWVSQFASTGCTGVLGQSVCITVI